MDTYWSNDYNKCAKCGICVETCKKQGYGFLSGGRNQSPYAWFDNMPCHHCGACAKACPYDAVIIERY